MLVTKSRTRKADSSLPQDSGIQNEVKKEEENKGEEKERLKNRGRKIMIGLIISLNAVMFGYSLKEITSVELDRLV